MLSPCPRCNGPKHNSTKLLFYWIKNVAYEECAKICEGLETQESQQDLAKRLRALVVDLDTIMDD